MQRKEWIDTDGTDGTVTAGVGAGGGGILISILVKCQ